MNSEEIRLYGREEEGGKPLGKSWEEWTIDFWNWLLSISIAENPANDDTGKYCSINQAGPVWFLTNGASGPLAKRWRIGSEIVTRRCEIPKGKAILVLAAGGVVSTSEHPYIFSSEEYLKRYVEFENVRFLEAKLNGITLTKDQFDKKRYLITTEVFDLNYVENNIFEAPEGPSRALASGYFLFLKPPTVDKLTIYINQVTDANTLLSTHGFEQHIEYEIKIV
jgi:hypothetical protein